MKYYLIAGEASGDLHGSNLLKALSARDAQAEFRAWGGERMQAAGATLVKHYRDLAFMGFVEVVANLRTILKNIDTCKADVESFAPDVLILIDYPGFNMRIAKWAKAKGIKVVYYISPQIWAWKQKRGWALKRDVDLMLCILPFESDFYERHFQMESTFVGHPLLDAIQNRPDFKRENRLRALGLEGDKPLLLLLPGSRKQEIGSMLPIMLEAAKRFDDHQVVIAGAPSQEASTYAPLLGDARAQLIFEQTYNLLEVAQVAMVTSGTATLETALFNVPQVVCYKGNWISYWIARQLVKIPYISLVNLIADREVVKELIQGELTVKRIAQELKPLSVNGSPEREQMLRDFADLRRELGGAGASDRAAEAIQQLMNA